MINLIIDIGNSFVKTAFFKNKDLLSSEIHDNFTENTVKHLLSIYQVEAAILSSVRPHDQKAASLLSDNCLLIQLTHQTPVPVDNYYESSETLGMDRLAGVAGASEFFPGKNCLIIDAGTCITYDLITAEKKYLGGSISPGLNMRFKALHNFTGNLPLLNITEINYICGKTTEESVLSGVINGTIAEIDEIINKYKQYYPDLNVIMSGGDMFFFDKKLKNQIFALEKIVLFGLNEILNYNVKIYKNK